MEHLQDKVAARKNLRQNFEKQEPNPSCNSTKSKSSQGRAERTQEARDLSHTRLTKDNLKAAERVLAYYVQQKHWKDEIESL